MKHIFLQEVSKKDALCNKVEWFWRIFVVSYVKIRERWNNFFDFFFSKTLADSKNSRTFALAIENESNQTMVW